MNFMIMRIDVIKNRGNQLIIAHKWTINMTKKQIKNSFSSSMPNKDGNDQSHPKEIPIVHKH